MSQSFVFGIQPSFPKIICTATFTFLLTIPGSSRLFDLDTMVKTKATSLEVAMKKIPRKGTSSAGIDGTTAAPETIHASTPSPTTVTPPRATKTLAAAVVADTGAIGPTNVPSPTPFPEVRESVTFAPGPPTEMAALPDTIVLSIPIATCDPPTPGPSGISEPSPAAEDAAMTDATIPTLPPTSPAPGGSTENPFSVTHLTEEEIWEAYLAKRNKTASVAVASFNSDMGGLTSAGLNLRKPGASYESKPPSAKPAFSPDAFIKFVKINLLGRILLACRLVPNNTTRKCYPDFKLFKLLQLYKEAKIRQIQQNAEVVEERFCWMESIWFDERYRLWFVNQKPVMAQASNYATRLYTMTWPEDDVSDAQVMILAKTICEQVNAYRVAPERVETRADAAVLIENENDPSTLFWIPSSAAETIVCNEFMSNAAALEILSMRINHEFGDRFFNSNQELVSRFFVKGTMDLTSALRVAAPLDWMTKPAKSEWRILHNIPEPEPQTVNEEAAS